ncbi:bestrophin family protein [Skeletonema marinoi]|uniref:Bestrophin family protein n=1 Tax=Skeletonema marinoi TaxID=267567 RepID=A0AAD8YEK0_9STRA|nr:bestrophin family protein [Skeletonema marinoi]
MAKDAIRLPTIIARSIIILFFVICCTYTSTCFADAFQSSGSIRFSSLVDRNPSRTIIRAINSSSSTTLFSSRNFDLDSNDRAQPTRIERTEDERAYIESVLRTNVLFQDVVRQGSLIDLASAFDRVEYKKGDTIFSQGDTDKDYMLILEEGECSITIDGEEIPGIYGTMRPPAMVGELALLMDKDRAATVIAKTNVVAFRLDRASFKYFMTGPLVKAEDIKTEIRNIDHVIDQISGVKKRYGGDIIRQFKPSRRWLWGRWHGTILQQAWKAAATSMLVSTCFVAAIRFFCRPSWAPGQIPDPNFPIVSRLIPLAKLWHYLMSITTFILTFFLSQAYTLWRNMYDTTRKIQGRINDIGLLVASTVERDDQGKYTKRGEDLLDDIGNYTRLFHLFCWAKYSKKFQVLSTSRGMSRMLSRGIMSRTEYNTLTSLSSSNGGPHNACLTWILVKCLTAMKDNTLPNDHALRDLLFRKMCDLRGTFAGIGDQLDGRIPLAYAHFVQVLVDSFLLIAPFALYSELGIWSIPAVGLLTLFYAGLLDLAKILLDPLDNDEFYDAPVNFDIGVLIRESNAGSTRWKYSAEMLPFATNFES